MDIGVSASDFDDAYSDLDIATRNLDVVNRGLKVARHRLYDSTREVDVATRDALALAVAGSGGSMSVRGGALFGRPAT